MQIKSHQPGLDGPKEVKFMNALQDETKTTRGARVKVAGTGGARGRNEGEC